MKYKGIFLDIDNTIYDYPTSHKAAIKKVISKFSVLLSKSEKKILNSYNDSRSEIHKELQGSASSHNRLLYFQRTFEKLDHNPLLYSLDAYNYYWDVFIENMNLFEGVVAFLIWAKKHCKICFVTDLTADIQFKKIFKKKLFKYADNIVTSEEAGKEKPNPAIFILALKKLGLNCSEVCMIGDSVEKDIQGANNLGIKAYWKTDDASIKTERINTSHCVPFSNFNNLKKLLNE